MFISCIRNVELNLFFKEPSHVFEIYLSQCTKCSVTYLYLTEMPEVRITLKAIFTRWTSTRLHDGVYIFGRGTDEFTR